MELITDENLLRQPCSPVSVGEGLRLGRQLHTFLLRLNKEKLTRRAVGLAAPQVGIYKRVCVIVYNQPLTLVNPRITKQGKMYVETLEECLSLPGKQVLTSR